MKKIGALTLFWIESTKGMICKENFVTVMSNPVPFFRRTQPNRSSGCNWRTKIATKVIFTFPSSIIWSFAYNQNFNVSEMLVININSQKKWENYWKKWRETARSKRIRVCLVFELLFMKILLIPNKVTMILCAYTKWVTNLLLSLL